MFARMIRFFSPPLSGAHATADFYFIGAVGDLIAASRGQNKPIRRLGPYSFACGRSLVIIRYITEAELDLIGRGAWADVYYIVDDILPEAAACDELPSDYRKRLADFAAAFLARILALNPIILAPSPLILEAFPGYRGEIIQPCAPGVTPPRPGAFWEKAPLRIAFFGTRSHEASLPLLEAIARHLNDAKPGASLTLFFGRHAPATLSQIGAIDNRAPLSWQAFRLMLKRERFHIGLAPLQDTRFARARSITKILDHGAAGAAGIYSDGPPFSGAVTHGLNGLLLPHDAQIWAQKILQLDADRQALRAMAEAGHDLAQRLGDPAALRSFWLERLGLRA